jgi:hypothetical protein
MRFITIACVLLAGISFAAPGYAQGMPSSSAAPKYQQAPVGHRQPRPTDPGGGPGGSNAPSTTRAPDATGPDMLDPDGRLNRALNSVCRGC